MKKGTTTNRLPNKVRSELRKVFGKLEIADAKKPLLLFPDAKDFKSATRLDPYNCGFKRAAARLCGATAALVFKSAAYFDYPGEDGVRRIYRHIPTSAAREAIEAFDAKGPEAVKTGRCFRFEAVSKSYTLKEHAARQRKERKGPKRALWEARLAKFQHKKAEVRLHEIEGDLRRQKARLDRLSEQYSPKAKSVLEAKTQVDRLSKVKAEQRERVADARLKVAETEKKAEKIRQIPYRPHVTKGTIHNLEVRNGSGYLAAARASGP